MQTVILAADRRAGAGPLSAVASTPMLPVGDRPLAAHAADAAVAAGASELVFAVADNATRVQSYFGGRHGGAPVSYAVCEERGRPSGALRAVRDRLDGRVAVLDATTYVDGSDVAALFERSDAAGASTVAERRGRGDGGEVSPGGAAHAPAVVGCTLPTDALADVSADAETLRDVVDAVGADAEVVHSSRTVTVETPADLVTANELALTAGTAASSNRDAAAAATGFVRVADGATVESGVTLDGPVLVANGATIETGSVLRGPVVVGPDATVGAGARVESAVLFEDAAVEAGATVDGGVFGPGCAVSDDAAVGSVSGYDGAGAAAFVADGGRDGLRYWLAEQ